MGARSRAQDEAAVAIGAFDEVLVAHFQIDARMAKRPATAVAGDAGVSTSMISGASTGMGMSCWAGGDHSRRPRPRNPRRLAVGTGAVASAMVTLNRIYTKTGDKGETGLGDGSGCPNMRCASRLSARWTRPMRPSAWPGCMQRRNRRDAGAHPERPVRSGRRSVRARRRPAQAKARLRIADAQVERLEREIDAMNARAVAARRPSCCRAARLRGVSASGAHHRAARRAADRGTGWNRKGRRRRPQICQPAVGPPFRRQPVRQRQGRQGRALDTRRQPVIRPVRAHAAQKETPAPPQGHRSMPRPAVRARRRTIQGAEKADCARATP